MIYIIIILVSLFFFLSLLETRASLKGNFINTPHKHTILYIVGVILFFIVLFRPSSMPDYKSYILDFKYLDEYKDLSMEIGDKFLIKVLRYVYDHHLVVFAGFAAIGISLKLSLLGKCSPFLFMSLALYTSGVLINQEMIAIRSSIAVGFFWWSFYFYQNKVTKYYVLFAILAFLFHYSGIILFLLWFLNKTNIYRLAYSLLIPLSYLIYYLNLGISNFFDLINIEMFQALWMNYKYFDESDYYNVFNAFLLAKCIFFYFILYRIHTIKKYYPSSVSLLKIYCWSIVMNIILYESQSAAIRVGEFLCSTEVLLIPSILYAYGTKHRVQMNFLCLMYCVILIVNYGSLVGW